MSTNVITPTPPAPSRGPLGRLLANRWTPLMIILTGTFMVVLDFFIVNVAMPSMQSRLHASSGQLEWVAAGYGLTTAVFLVTAGRLGDGFGRRRMFTTGLALFTISSGLCGLAPNPTILVVGRLVQGLGAALLMPNVLSLISVLYGGSDRARALSAYGMAMGLAAVGGQLIGGILIQWNPGGLDWRSCFLINIPIGACGIALAARVIPESRSGRPARIDPLGTLLLTAGLTAIVLPLIAGRPPRAHGWPLWTWASLAEAPVLLGVFIAQQRRRARRGVDAMLPFTLFRQRTFSAALACQALFWVGQASFFLILALYLQQGRGLSPLHAGLVFTTLAVAYLGTSSVAPQLTVRHGRSALALGALTLAAGHALLLGTVAMIGIHGSVLALIPALMVIGAGMGLGIGPLATIALSGVTPADAGDASGQLATMQNVGNAVGVAVIGAVYFGSLSSGVPAAFELSLGVLAGALTVVALLTRLLPARALATEV